MHCYLTEGRGRVLSLQPVALYSLNAHCTRMECVMVRLTLRSTNLCPRKTVLPLVKPYPSHTLLMVFRTHTTSRPGAGLQEATLPLVKQLSHHCLSQERHL